jgi:hypothetical protein
VTTSSLAVQTPVEFDVTEVVPSPVVLTVAVMPPPMAPEAGRFEMVGVVGGPRTVLVA